MMLLVDREQFKLIVANVILSVLIGTIVAFFLIALESVTFFRAQNGYIIYLLPFAGVALYFFYKHYGQNTLAGNNLIIEEIHEPLNGVPWQMAPIILFATLYTHLFGGSAGREGTAVQIGGSIAHRVGVKMGIQGDNMRLMLWAGMAAGFGAVFGTPFAGAIFAIEVVSLSKLRHTNLFHCLAAGWLGHLVCLSWGVHHTKYSIVSPNFTLTTTQLATLIASSLAFGLASRLFVHSSHLLKSLLGRVKSPGWTVPFFGSVVLLLLCKIVGTTDYLGLGVNATHENGVSIVSAFRAGGASPFSWLYKLLFTVITLSIGFKGGEVTPLFFIGAALGSAIACQTGMPVDLFAAFGFIAVFGAATNTPLASAVMGIELFGPSHIGYFLLVCFLAYWVSGRARIYTIKAQN